MKCKIEWVDPTIGSLTPDFNDAICLATNYDPVTFGEQGSESFPICETHANQKGKYWKLSPLPDQEEKDWPHLVKMDMMYFQIIPNTVIESIKKSFSDQYTEILKQLKWNRDHFYFERWGMYVGVELDGYIHT